MILKKDNKTVIWFEDITSLAAAQVSKENIEMWRDKESGDAGYGINWLGVHGGIPEVRRIVELHGWPEGVKKGKEALGNFTVPRLPQFKRKRVRSDQGHALDIHSVYQGELHRAWESSKKEQSNRLAMRGHVNIVIDIGTNGGTGSSSYFWRGAVGCLLAEALIKSGRHVRIIAVDCTRNLVSGSDARCYNKVIVATILKPFTAPLDLNRMFSATALSGFYRYYYFKANAILDVGIRSTFGRADDFKIDDIDYFLDETPCIIVSRIWNQEQANRRLKILAEQIEGKVQSATR